MLKNKGCLLEYGLDKQETAAFGGTEAGRPPGRKGRPDSSSPTSAIVEHIRPNESCYL